jgi:hypothetical protein
MDDEEVGGRLSNVQKVSKAGCEAVQAAANDAYAHRSGDDACSNEHLLICRIARSLYAT